MAFGQRFPVVRARNASVPHALPHLRTLAAAPKVSRQVPLSRAHQAWTSGSLLIVCLMTQAVTSFTASALTPLGAAEVIRVTDENYDQVVPQGKEVDAIVGDYVLRNDHVCIVIAQPAPWRHANLTIRNVGGAILDFSTRVDSNDQLGLYSPLAGRYTYHQLPAEHTDAWQESGQTVALEFQSQKAADGTTCRVIYRLADHDRFVSITTVVSNPTQEVRSIPVRDAMRADRTFTDGIDAAGATCAHALFWVDDRWFPQAYGVVAEGWTPTKASGRGPMIDWQQASGNAVSLEPAGEFEMTRRFYAAPHRLALRGVVCDQPTVPVSLLVQDTWGPVSDALLTCTRGAEPYAHAVTDAQGRIDVLLPPGDWQVQIQAQGRPTLEKQLAIQEPTEQTIELESAGRIEARVVDDRGDKIPFKLALDGQNGTASPNFGPDSRAWACGNVAYSANGHLIIDVAPGTYEFVCSHGPEHDVAIETIQVEAGRVTPLNAVLPRVVDTTGWVSTEYHSHSSPSGDNTSDQLGRVLNLLAEHLEFAPCTEHARIDSYAPHLQSLGVIERMATCSGMELTGGPLPVNHQNAFPLVHRARRQNGGGPETDINPVVQIERLAMWDAGAPKLVQTNHPNLKQIYGDVNTDGVADEGLKGMFGFMDVMEVHPPASLFQTPATDQKPSDGSPVMFHWMQLLNLGYRIPGVVNTDAHYNLHGSGWLRNYVRSSTDLPAEIQVDEMVRNSEAGRIVMTSGPFLEVLAHSGTAVAIPGEDLAAQERTVELEIRVQCPNWLDINRVQVFINGRPSTDLHWTRRDQPDAFGNGVTKFQQRVSVQLEQDAHLIVGAIGEGLQLGRVMGNEFGTMPPVAVANPIFVDVDGDGFKANGDDLDHPLPVIAK